MDNTSMREALEAARNLLLPQCNGGTTFAKACGETVSKIMDALKEERTSDGDCAKLREALEATLNLFWDIHNANRSPQSNQAYAVIRQIKAALAAPPRICDVNDCKPLADFIIKSLHGSQLLKAVDALTLAVVYAAIRAALEIAYAPVKVLTSNPKEGGNDGNK